MDSTQGIVNNGDCIDTAGFYIGHESETVIANITTENARKHLTAGSVSHTAYYVIMMITIYFNFYVPQFAFETKAPHVKKKMK